MSSFFVSKLLICSYLFWMPSALCVLLVPFFFADHRIWGTILFLMFVVAIFVDKVPYNGHGRPVKSFRRLNLWKIAARYFPLSTRQEEPLDPKGKYIFACHPHGIFGAAVWMNFAFDATGVSAKNHDIDVAVATVGINFLLPIWRDMLLAIGFIDASFSSLLNALRLNRSVVVVIGGAAEALDSHNGRADLTLRRRKGFIRLALQSGASLVPVYNFGETELYNQVSNPRGSLLRAAQEKLLSMMKFSLPLVWGTGLFFKYGVLPKSTPLRAVIGTPLKCPDIDRTKKIPESVINSYHDEYIMALKELYAKYQPMYAPNAAPLNIVS